MNDPWQSAGPVGRTGAPRSSAVAAGTGEDSTAPSLFDVVADEGRRRRDDGQRTALHAADVRWKAAAQTAIRTLAATRDTFTAEDLRAEVGHLASSPNAIGAALAAAARRSEIVCVGAEPARRPEAHARLIRVWAKAGEA